ncbi:MAG TPA: rhodanese-related sulfurtransferase [Candidatus Saccharimonadales bacterium]|nr:rhodanese-related sulfurtransferase [Candidatus Saccharimonadales bacterium]
MPKVILFYKFVPLNDPEVIKHWQRALAENLGLKGRILIADHGINGTLGGEVKDLKAYVKSTKSHEAFKDISFKWSDASGDEFGKLIVKVRPEIVTFGVPDEIEVSNLGVVGGGKKLNPNQLHKLIKDRGEDVVFFDGRNAHEAEVGKFKNAVVPDIKFSRDFVKELDKPNYEAIKNNPVVTYCTGGIRCEILSSLMLNRGFREVYQLDGGIVKYGEQFGDDGLWEGALYVFDSRVTTKFSNRAKDIGECLHCSNKTSTYVNCANKSCNKHFLICNKCRIKQLCPACTEARLPIY